LFIFLDQIDDKYHQNSNAMYGVLPSMSLKKMSLKGKIDLKQNFNKICFGLFLFYATVAGSVKTLMTGTELCQYYYSKRV